MCVTRKSLSTNELLSLLDGEKIVLGQGLFTEDQRKKELEEH